MLYEKKLDLEMSILAK